MKKVLYGLFVCLLLISGTSWSEAPDEPLFIDSGDTAPRILEPAGSPLVVRQRPVDIRFELFSGDPDEVESLLLNLFPDVQLKAFRERVEKGDSGGFAWIGRVDGSTENEVILVVENRRMSGTITLPGKRYQVRPLDGDGDGDVHVVREIKSPDLSETSLMSSATLLAQESEVIDLVNQERAIAGLHPLANNSRLASAAIGHSEDMAQQNYFSHTSLDGRSFSQRLTEAGYIWITCAENIAAGYSTAQLVVNGWMNSAGHRANILNSNYCDVGVGYAYEAGSSYRHYWTMDLGRQQGVSKCPVQPPPDPPPPPPPPPPPDPQDVFYETGIVSEVDGNWKTVNLSRNYSSMVVVCTPVYDRTLAPHVVRLRNAGGNSFQLRAVRVDRSGEPSGRIFVHYIVMEEGVYTATENGIKMEAVKALSRVNDGQGSWVGQPVGYSNSYQNPVVLGQVMTSNDPDFSTFWCYGASRTEPPDRYHLHIGKSSSEDPDRARADETIGYIVIEAGSGVLGGVACQAGIGGDLVKGMDNAPPYSYPINGLSSPRVAVVSIAGLDSGNGGWAVLYGDTPLTPDSLYLAVDEDALVDTERSHTTEQIGYIVFEGSGMLPEKPSNPDPADGSGNVGVSTVLRWNAGAGAISHDVYFGDSPQPPFIGNQETTDFSPGQLYPGKTYYWRVDEKNQAGTTRGDVWSFTTGSGGASWVLLTYDDFEGGWGNFAAGGSDCFLYTGGVDAPQGANAVDIQDDRGSASSFSYAGGRDVQTPGYTEIEVDFWFKAISMDIPDEDFYVEYYDGAQWHTVARYAKDVDFKNKVVYNKKVYIHRTNYAFPKNMNIRFRCDASGNSDDVYIDKIKVSAR